MGGDPFNLVKFWNTKGVSCHIPSGNGCFPECDEYSFMKDFTEEYFEFIQSYKRRNNVMAQYRIPEFCDPIKIHIGKYSVKRRRLLRRSVIERNICFHIHKNHYCLIGKKNRRDSLVNGVEEIERNCQHVNIWIKEDDLSQRICNIFPNQDDVNQKDSIFVFHLNLNI